MYTSNRIPHDSGLYHEHVFHGDTVVAQILSDPSRCYRYVINGHRVSAGYRTVGEAKAALFPVLDGIYG